MKGLAAVVGVGKGIGGSVAKLLARSGYKGTVTIPAFACCPLRVVAVAIFARNQNYKGADKLTPLVEEIVADGGSVLPFVMNAAEPSSVDEVFAHLRAACPGEDVSLLVYNAGARDMAPLAVEDTSVDKFVSYWKVRPTTLSHHCAHGHWATRRPTAWVHF